MTPINETLVVDDPLPKLVEQYRRMGITELGPQTQQVSSMDQVPSLAEQYQQLGIPENAPPFETISTSSPSRDSLDTVDFSELLLRSLNRQGIFTNEERRNARPHSAPTRRNTAYEIVFVNDAPKRRNHGRSKSVDWQERAVVRPYSPRPHKPLHMRSWMIPSPRPALDISSDSNHAVPIFQMRRNRVRHSPYGTKLRRRAIDSSYALDPMAMIGSSSIGRGALPEASSLVRANSIPLTVQERLYLRQLQRAARSTRRLDSPIGHSGRVTELTETISESLGSTLDTPQNIPR